MCDIGKDDHTILNKCFYCIVQATRQYRTYLGFVGDNVNTCLYVKMKENVKFM